MVIAAPNLDDRRFQDLVDDAKRMVMDRCPEWTDHNVSDPGVTLIETFAFMTDQLLYRLNRVPDRLYVKFLELIGLRLFPPTAARADVTFWLSSPAVSTLIVPAGTRTATLRGESEEPVVFSTLADLALVPVSIAHVATQAADVDGIRQRTDQLGVGAGFSAFSDVPMAGDVLYVGLDQAAPGNAVAIRMHCEIDGVGVDPTIHPSHGRRGTGRTGCAASSRRTRPAASTGVATSSSTCRSTTTSTPSTASAPGGCGPG